MPVKRDDQGGRVPYGYVRRLSIDHKKYRITSTISVAPLLIPIINTIFSWRRNGKSLAWIANNLNEAKHVAPQGGKIWYARTVKIILDNEPYYRGDYDEGFIKGFPRILY